VWDGVYADAQSQRGEELSKAGCASCHGDELAGSDLAPALQGDDFRGAWSGRTAAELFEKVQTTMPADRAGTLKPQQSADLVAYIFKINDYPAGAADLASEMPALQQIKITSKK
jgi:quinoprotein glucose dehydrogenase